MKSKQGDVNSAFLHIYLPGEETVYVSMSQEFIQYVKKYKAKTLSLKRCLCDLKKTVYDHFGSSLQNSLKFADSSEASWIHAFLLLSDTVIAVIYVDNISMFELAQLLNKEGVDPREENDAAFP